MTKIEGAFFKRLVGRFQFIFTHTPEILIKLTEKRLPEHLLVALPKFYFHFISHTKILLLIPFSVTCSRTDRPFCSKPRQEITPYYK